MSTVTLTDVIADESTIRYEFDASGRMRRFLSGEDFFAEYDADIGGVPDAILTIPWLANVAPIAWANGATIRVSTVDETFLHSLRAVGRSLVEMYPAFMEGGAIRVGEVVPADDERLRDATANEKSARGQSTRGRSPRDEQADGGSNAGVMFSGGVDSLATFLRHRDERPVLFSVNGFDVRLHRPDAWERKEAALRSFGEKHGLENAFVRANMTSFHDQFMVHSHFRRYIDSNWFDAVQAGLGLLGLCAPVAHRKRIETLYMAGSYSEEYPHAVSFHPSVVDNVAWTPTTVAHDAYELTRQDKIERIAEYVTSEDPDLTIHTCLQSEVGNCNQCEKCARTVAGLYLAGLDPNRHGYDADGQRFAVYREKLEGGEWQLTEGVKPLWKDIQNAISFEREFPNPETRAFFEWLDRVDIDDLVAQSTSPVSRSVVRALARDTPYEVYASLYPVYRTARRALTSE